MWFAYYSSSRMHMHACTCPCHHHTQLTGTDYRNWSFTIITACSIVTNHNNFPFWLQGWGDWIFISEAIVIIIIKGLTTIVTHAGISICYVAMHNNLCYVTLIKWFNLGVKNTYFYCHLFSIMYTGPGFVPPYAEEYG